MAKVNSSLAYEILLYLNSCYLILFVICEVAMGILKAWFTNYPENALLSELCLFILLYMLEVLRIFLGRRGNMVNKKAPVIFSIFLTAPSAMGVSYFLIYQTYILRLEYFVCAVLLTFQGLELVTAIQFLLTFCKNPVV